MAALIQLLALLLAADPHGKASGDRGLSQRLLPADWESISLELRASPEILRAVVREQSFRMDAHVTVLSYFLGPPAGELKRGELGLVVICDGKLTQVARATRGNPVTAIDAVAFLDLNGDGMRDVVMIVRYLGLPGPKERPGIAFFVARKDGTFVIDPGAAPWAVEAKTIAEVKALMKAAKEPEPPLPPPTHRYSLDGFMRGKSKKCTGKAVMEQGQDDEKSPCLEWTLSEVKCKGKGEVDWVHNEPADPNGSSESICYKEGQWTFVSDPQKCDVVVNREVGMPANVSAAKASFLLDCTWPCRGGNRSACDGGASYDFVPLSGAANKRK